MRNNILVVVALAAHIYMCAACAGRHVKITESTAALGAPQRYCTTANDECRWERPWRAPNGQPQLTPTGCVLHTLLTGGHVAWECRGKEAKHGRWLWRHEYK